MSKEQIQIQYLIGCMDRNDIVRLATKFAMRLIELEELEYLPEDGEDDADLVDPITLESVLCFDP